MSCLQINSSTTLLFPLHQLWAIKGKQGWYPQIKSLARLWEWPLAILVRLWMTCNVWKPSYDFIPPINVYWKPPMCEVPLWALWITGWDKNMCSFPKWEWYVWGKVSRKGVSEVNGHFILINRIAVLILTCLLFAKLTPGRSILQIIIWNHCQWSKYALTAINK